MRAVLATLRRLFRPPSLRYDGLAGLVIGLGNPGPRYASTRHNAGWMVVERLARRAGQDFRPGRGDFHAARWTRPAGDVLLVLPTTFMNRSGEAGARLLELTGLAPADCLVLVDDLDLPLGRLRLRARGSDGGHRGLASLTAAWASDAFPRLRLGIGRPADDTVEHVLAPFADAELDTAERMIEAAADAVSETLDRGLERAASHFNALQIT
ncbi:MAG: aminoacyl-tRNA hydrolase [Candidatus Krumholzibacteriia bacterium]